MTAADSLPLAGVEVAERPNRPVLLVFHGHRSAASDALAWCRPRVAEGYSVAAAE